MSEFPFRIVGFDLDGTLVDSALDLAPAVNHALLAAGRDAVSLETTRSLIGGGARRMLERALEVTGGPVEAPHFEDLHAALLEHYTANIAANTRPYEGCLDALDILAGHGCQLAVVTNKAEDLARKLIEELGLTSRFASIMGGDTLGRERAKPAPDMIHETIARCGGGHFAMVGDSTFDVKAAKNASVPAVAFSFGYHDVPPEELGADVLIHHFNELVPALARF
ncbi:HAD-IA family hydrolase [Alteraurantiacibacter aquimixticola]|uniref:Phosphoglycolate phosphatase n=1 Tax=Alteraurantiacibacter aquimixticola TaxID=2489173 RepID=A0A4T3F381_9SPHN|nr:HAD-IA family hydrolase [Alteraurantiacibacter aquimixticola]TIX51608.1 HAD family hydrolase [Alteraurantiacibacter aquimixticola]